MVYELNIYMDIKDKLENLITKKLAEKGLNTHEVVGGDKPLEFFIEDLLVHNKNLNIKDVCKNIAYIYDSGNGLEVGRYVNSWWWTKYGYDDLEAVADETVKILEENENFIIEEIEN